MLDTFSRPRPQGQDRGPIFAAWGGAYNRRPPVATAFVHRDMFFSLQHSAIVDPAVPAPEKRAAHTWVTQLRASVHPWGSGRVYPNFPDPDLHDWEASYDGENYPRLLEVKAAYDPENVFRFQLSLPVE